MNGKIMSVAILLLAFLVLSSAPIVLAQPSTPHDPISIDGNNSFPQANGVTSGDGTQSDPYIIENWVIDAADNHGIWIRNTDNYFVIRNCLVENGGSSCYGIYLENVINGKIENNTCRSNNRGICLTYSDNCAIKNNTCGSNKYGISLIYSDECTTENNTCSNNSGDGIHLRDSDNCTIDNNTCSNNYCGISLDFSNNNTIINCNIENNGAAGIYTANSFGNEAHYSNIVGNGTYGVQNLADTTFDATLNWWGTTDIVFINNSIEGKVYAEPWLDAPYPEGESVNYWSIIEALESDVDNLVNRIGVIENGVGTLENELETLRSRVDALENDPDNLTTQIGSLKVEVNNLQIKISGIEFSISELDSRISKLDENMSDLLIRISEFKSEVENHETRILSLESEATNLDARVEWLEMTVRLHETRILSLENQVNTLMDMVAELRALVGGQASEIAGLQEDLANFIAGTQLWVSSIENRLSELGVTDNALWGTIKNVKSDLEGIELTPGPKGPKGSTGDPGPQGPQGSPGSQGPSGITPAEIEELKSKIEELETRLSELESSPGTLSAPAGGDLELFPWALVPGAIAAVVLVGAVAAFYRLRGWPCERPRK